MTGTTSNNQYVTATVVYYNPDKGFGFAESGGERIFFHQSACREVEGTPEEPIITVRHSDNPPRWWKGCRHSEKIVLKATTSPKGLKASAWGSAPTRTWVEELEFRGTLNHYVGGHVEIKYSQRSFGRVLRESKGKLTAAPALRRDGDNWLLHVQYDAYDGPHGGYGESSGHLELALEMGTGTAPQRSHYGRYSLDIHDTRAGEWVYVTFFPAGQWIGN